MSENIDEFLDVGKEDGLCIWRIENFKLVKISNAQYGSFNEGDSYLILNTKELKNSNFEWSIHFWLGINSTLDEMGTAAIKAVNLDDYLGGKPVQYREVQYHESKLFHSYFEKYGGIRYLMGGIKSGFNIIGNEQSEKRLFMVKGKKDVRIIQVKIEKESLNKSDSFILEDGIDIYQWNPPGTNRMERMKANIYAKKLRDDEHAGRGNIIVLEEDWDTNEKFWNIFNCKCEDISETSNFDDKDFEINFHKTNLSLFRVSDSYSSKPTIKLVSEGSLNQSMLCSDDCFIIDAQTNGIFSWIGKKCTKNEKLATVEAVKELIIKNNHSNYVPMLTCIEGAETVAFKSIFSNWNEE